MILHLLAMRRNVNRNGFNDRKNVSATTSVPAHSNMAQPFENSSANEIAHGECCRPRSFDAIFGDFSHTLHACYM